MGTVILAELKCHDCKCYFKRAVKPGWKVGQNIYITCKYNICYGKWQGENPILRGTMTLLAYQGIPGSYSEKAARKTNFDLVQCKSFSECMCMVENGDVDLALLPIENSTDGGVSDANDLLVKTSLNITSEIYLSVSHCLIGFGKKKDVKRIYSHQQALHQCSKLVTGRETIQTTNTAESVKMIKALNDRTVAAIASKEASNIYGVPVIEEHVNDVSENYTRFLTLGRDESGKTGNDKTTIHFILLNELGSLHSVLSVLLMNGINVTRIESRPLKTGRWEYGFIVDFTGHRNEQRIDEMLKRLMPKTKLLHVLGSYPSELN